MRVVTRRSKSFLAAEAIAAYVEVENWWLTEIEAGIRDLERGHTAGHDDESCLFAASASN
ncbi:MAG TPA: hypothetical protein VKG79_04520 [Bryobacteraceae bacterium]|nr:hypothetical protein [Bryobacteraceae bacterium]